MPFNSDTYHANKQAREAEEHRRAARQIREAIAAGRGNVIDTEERARFHDRMAELSELLARSYREHAATRRDMRRRRFD